MLILGAEIEKTEKTIQKLENRAMMILTMVASIYTIIPMITLPGVDFTLDTGLVQSLVAKREDKIWVYVKLLSMAGNG